MSENNIYKPISTNPHIKDIDEYHELYKESIDNSEAFFQKLAKENISWISDFNEVQNDKFANTKWFIGGKTNVSLNCIDRHLDENSNKTALIWEGDDPNESKQFTYKELHLEVCKFANVGPSGQLKTLQKCFR